MANIATTAQPPPGVIAKALQPWEKIDIPPDRIPSLFNDWGSYFSKKQMPDDALKHFNRSLEIDQKNPRTSMKRSQCFRQTGSPKKSVIDATRAAEHFFRIYGYEDATANHELCKALYEDNQFENCKVALHDNVTKFTANKCQPFEKLIKIVNENFSDSLSQTHTNVIEKLVRATEESRKPKIELTTECDVQSTIEEEEVILSPLEIARRKRAFEIYYQTYLCQSWSDQCFLKTLLKNPGYDLPQAPHSSAILKDLTKTGFTRAKKFTKILHARNPLYNTHFEKYPDRKLFEKHSENNLYRIQNQTRRNMLYILDTVRKLKQNGNNRKLTNFVEDVMSNFVCIKTRRVMPWKFEFICEVYNLLALALIKPYTEPIDIESMGTDGRLLRLLKLPNEKLKEKSSFIFNDRSAYTNSEEVDQKVLNYKNFVTHLERRLLFAKYSIERVYLMHEIARAHLENNSFSACCYIANNAFAEAKKCESKLWQFLILMLQAKAHAILGQIEQEHIVLKEARDVAERLQSSELSLFAEICLRVNAEDWEMKKFLKFQERSKLRKLNTKNSSRVSLEQVPADSPEAQKPSLEDYTGIMPYNLLTDQCTLAILDLVFK